MNKTADTKENPLEANEPTDTRRARPDTIKRDREKKPQPINVLTVCTNG